MNALPFQKMTLFPGTGSFFQAVGFTSDKTWPGAL